MGRRRDLLENAAFAQGREAQAGVVLGFYENAYNPASTRFASASIPIGTGDFTIEYFGNFFGVREVGINTLCNLAQPIPYKTGSFMVYGYVSGNGKLSYALFEGDSGADSLEINYGPADPLSLTHLVITRYGTTVDVYIKRSLQNRKIQSSVKNFPDFRLGLANSSDVALCRMFNYALSDTEVATLWNGGDPAGHVLPTALKDHTPIAPETGRDSGTWTGPESVYGIPVNLAQPLRVGITYLIDYEISGYEAGAPFLYLGPLSNGNQQCRMLAENGRHQVVNKCSATYDNPPSITIYGGNPRTDRRLTVKIHSITPLGCIAEYVPQNIVPAVVDHESIDNIGDVWLDSAKQLPLNDEYLPPLRGSIGGYDLTASGVPKIAHKPTLTKVIRADLMATSGVFLNYWFSADKQPDATWRRLDGKIHINCGVTPVFNMPGVTLANCSFRVGKRYRVLCKWTLLKGDVRLTAFGNWANGKYTAIDSTFHTELKQYSWDSGILPYGVAQTPYNGMYLYFGNSLPDSEYTIDELILEEYD